MNQDLNLMNARKSGGFELPPFCSFSLSFGSL